MAINQQTVVDLFHQGRFEEAAHMAGIVQSDGDGMTRILALRPSFGDAVQLQGSEVFFRRVAELQQTASAVENLADVLNANGKPEEAAALRRGFYDRMPLDSPDRMRAREALAMLYRRLGDNGALDDLYSSIDLCAHLAPALRASWRQERGSSIVDNRGLRIAACGSTSTWSSIAKVYGLPTILRPASRFTITVELTMGPSVDWYARKITTP